MLLDIQGRVRNTQLPVTIPLLPLYEAIINSIEAIEDAGNDDGHIEVFIRRDKSGLQDRDGNITDDIVGFDIIDNGIGFNEENYNSFQTSDSSFKIQKGGKGVGRFLWLKAFNQVDIESVYKENDQYFTRRFSFVADTEGVKNLHVEPSNKKHTQTTVRLVGFKDHFQKHCPKKPDTITAHIIEYCLEYFLRPYCPRIMVHDDNGDTIDLNNCFDGDMLGKETDEFEINGEKFWAVYLRLRSSYIINHMVHYCADDRVVRSDRLLGKIPYLNRKLNDSDGHSFYFAAYIESGVLNQSVNSERSNFVLPEDSDNQLFDLTWKQINEAVVDRCAKHLIPYTDPIRNIRINDLNNFITQKAPIYRSLAKYITAQVDKIDTDEDDRQMELNIYKVYLDIQYSIKDESSEIFNEDTETLDLPAFEAKAKEYFEKVVDINRADLARYICHRKAVIEYLQKQLQVHQSGKYSTEDVIHSVIYPMGKTSDEVPIDEHNLWLIDERLVYHRFLASDKSLRSMDILGCESRKEPDIFILNTYDKVCAFSDSESQQVSSIVLVEFKRPMLGRYSDSDNPFVQLMDYIDEIKSGKAKTHSGRPIKNVLQPIPYYCYVICDINQDLVKLAERFGMMTTPDGQGFFGYVVKYNAYFEVISFDKMIGDSVKRNKVLFDKLNL